MVRVRGRVRVRIRVRVIVRGVIVRGVNVLEPDIIYNMENNFQKFIKFFKNVIHVRKVLVYNLYILIWNLFLTLEWLFRFDGKTPVENDRFLIFVIYIFNRVSSLEGILKGPVDL